MNISKSFHILPREDVIIKQSKDCRKTTIDLRGLSLTILPQDFFINLQSITILDLSFNHLTTLPSSLFELRSIKELYASHNLLRKLSSRVTNLSHLQILDVSHNCLDSLPQCLGSMASIRMVNCSGNNVTLLEPGVLAAPSLSHFSVTRNPIKNVPSDVYLQGLAPLRKHFGMAVPIVGRTSQLACENEHSKTFRERLNEIKLRRTKKREKLKLSSEQEIFRAAKNKTHVTNLTCRSVESAGQIQTSDYGSATSSVQNLEPNFWEECNRRGSEKDSSSCHGDHGSEGEDQISDFSDQSSWSEDVWNNVATPDFEDVMEEMDCILPNRTRFLKKCNVAILIPEHNKTNKMRSEFYLDIIQDVSLHPKMEKNWISASPVVSIGPDGTEFYKDTPAFIRLPIHVNLGNAKLRCLCSNTSEFERPSWTEMPASEFQVMKGFIVIRTFHLSFFTAVLDMSPAVVSTVVTPKEGGSLEVEQVPGVKVFFPPGSVPECIRATVKVISGELEEHQRTNLSPDDAVATPVVVLSPHGYLFQECEKNPVHVHLPIPNYLAIVQQFGPLAKLSLWQSRTSEEDPTSWQKLQVVPRLYHNEDGDYFVDVSVSHFSWLTGMWEGIKNSVGYSYQGGAVNMKCQAWMLESKESNKFGLVVICHNADKNIQEVGNYAINVGGSLKPVSVAPGGDIIVKLSKSAYFEPDTSADQDETLEKVHADYRGEEFEMQFACRFKGNAKPTNKDIFGKVLVKKKGSNQNLFAFNLIKKEENDDDEVPDPWAITSLRELADMHNVIANSNWKKLARSLGYTSVEVARFEKMAEPFDEIVAMYRRRKGSYEDFMKSFWEVAREVKLNPTGEEQGASEGETASSTWRNYFGLKSWLPSMGSTGNSSRASSSRVSSEDEENQPSTSGLNANRKRPIPQQSGSGSTSSSKRRKTRQGRPPPPNEEELLQQLRISPPQNSHASGSPGSSPPGSWTSHMRQTPLRNSTAQGHSSTHVVQSSSLTPHMSTTSAAPLLSSAMPRDIPSTSNATFQPRRLDDEMQRNDTTEITPAQLYRIAPLIQAHWYKLARLVRNDDNVESDIKDLKQQHEGAEEQATQMLLQWREKCPDVCNRGMLYGALVDLNLKSVGKKCEEIYQRSRNVNQS